MRASHSLRHYFQALFSRTTLELKEGQSKEVKDSGFRQFGVQGLTLFTSFVLFFAQVRNSVS